MLKNIPYVKAYSYSGILIWLGNTKYCGHIAALKICLQTKTSFTMSAKVPPRCPQGAPCCLCIHVI